MRTITDNVTIDAPRDKVWSVISDLPGVTSWGPMVTSATIESDNHSGNDAVRHCELAQPEGSTGFVRERFSNWRDGIGYSYEIVDGDLPVQRLVNTFELTDEGDRTTASMVMDVVPPEGTPADAIDEMEEMFSGMVNMTLNSLKNHIEGNR